MRKLLVGAVAALPFASAAHAQAPVPPPLSLTLVPQCKARGTEDIVVCGRRSERSPYRLPPLHDGFDPDGPVDSVARERHRLYEVGEVGIGSCTNVGPGGWTGCDAIAWKQAHQQHDGISRVGFGAKTNKGDF